MHQWATCVSWATGSTGVVCMWLKCWGRVMWPERGLCWPGTCRSSKLSRQVGGSKLAWAGVAGATWYPAASQAGGVAWWSLCSCHMYPLNYSPFFFFLLLMLNCFRGVWLDEDSLVGRAGRMISPCQQLVDSKKTFSCQSPLLLWPLFFSSPPTLSVSSFPISSVLCTACYLFCPTVGLDLSLGTLSVA